MTSHSPPQRGLPHQAPFSATAGLILALALATAASVVRVGADVGALPAWRVSGGVSTAIVHDGKVFVGGTFSQLYTPSSSEDQFYDLVTAQPRPQCARSTNPQRSLGGTPDGQGGLLVVVQPGDGFADANGPFVPPSDTTIVRVRNDCQWDRGFAAPTIDPGNPNDLTVGLPVRVGATVYASNSIVGPDSFLRAQVAAFDAVSGARLSFQIFPDIAEIGLLGPGPQGPVARVRRRDSFTGGFVLGSIAPTTLALTESTTALADELFGPRTWVRGPTLFRARPSPSNRLEAFDLTTLQPKSGWTAPVVPALADLEVVGNRVFLTSGSVNGQVVPQPAALLSTTGTVDATWTPPALTRRTVDPSGTPYVPVLTQLVTDGQRLYFSGDMERVGGTDRDGVAALSLLTGVVDSWNPAPLLVSPLEYTAGGLLMSRPTGANRVTRRYLAAIDKTTGIPTAWDPNDSARLLLHTVSPVSAIATDGAYLYFASATTGEVQRADLGTANVDQNWRFVVSRTGGQPGSVTAMVVNGGAVYLGGEFESVAGVGITATPRRAVAAVGADGALRPWAPALDGPAGVTLLRSLLSFGGTIYMGGGFSAVNGQFRLGFAAVDAVSHVLVQPEMFVLGDTRIRGLDTDGARVFVVGESFGAPFIGASSIPGSELEQFQVQDGTVPTSAAFVAGKLYAGLEYDTETGQATARTTRWDTVVAGPAALLHLVSSDGTVEYYTALPGTPPGAPVLTSAVVGNVVTLSWTPDPAGGAPSSYTLLVGSAPGAADLATFLVRGASSFTTPAPNGAYYVRAIPRNGFGPGPASNEVLVQVGPPPCTVPPASPGPLTFTTAGSAVSLAWGASPTAASYVLEAGQSTGASNLANLPLGNVTSFSASAPLGVYFVRVRAVNACGVSAPSNEGVVTLDGSVALPQVPTGLAAIVTGNAVLIRWTPPSSGGTPAAYRFEAGYSLGAANAAVVSTALPGFSAAGVPPATYYVRVRALNAAGAGPATADLAVTVP